MAKSTTPYWNPLTLENLGQWTPVRGLEGMAEELTLSMDPATGEYTRLTRFHPGADTTPFGGKSHDYPEEVFIVSGRLYDQAFDLWRPRTPIAHECRERGARQRLASVLPRR